jgi:hypothetical protein
LEETAFWGEGAVKRLDSRNRSRASGAARGRNEYALDTPIYLYCQLKLCNIYLQLQLNLPYSDRAINILRSV